MPSMRALASAGPALEAENACGFNCAYLEIKQPKDIAELMYLLMCGCGVGFSVETRCISQLPYLCERQTKGVDHIEVEDSRLGWAKAFHELLVSCWQGREQTIDYRAIRPKGTRLSTMGGQASGPEVLMDLFSYTQHLFSDLRKSKRITLLPIEVYDLCCKVASVVISGGVRRSATLCLFSSTDVHMEMAKTGDWFKLHPYRALSNISMTLREYDDFSFARLMRFFANLSETGSGEPGLVVGTALDEKAWYSGRKGDNFGLNPCGEIILKDKQFCNLVEVVCRPEDTLDSLESKVRSAVLLGLLQTKLVKFNDWLSGEWAYNSVEDPLIGVSLTGIMDAPDLLREPKELEFLKYAADEACTVFSALLGVIRPKAITCVKPSGTVSQLVDSSSGLHPRYAEFYKRNVKVSSGDPLSKFMVAQGFPHFVDTDGDTVFVFPCQSPSKAKVASKVSALEQLRVWHLLKNVWCDHNPSCTIYVTPREWPDVCAWVAKHFSEMSGITFLPSSDCLVYAWMPYEAISKDLFESLIEKLPKVDFSKLQDFEIEDTTNIREVACGGSNSCNL